MIALFMGKGVANQAVIPAKAGIQSPIDDVRIHNQICPNSRRKLSMNGPPLMCWDIVSDESFWKRTSLRLTECHFRAGANPEARQEPAAHG